MCLKATFVSSIAPYIKNNINKKKALSQELFYLFRVPNEIRKGNNEKFIDFFIC